MKSVHGALVFLYAILANLAVQMLASVIILVAGGSVGGGSVFDFAMMLLIQVGFVTVIYMCVMRPKRELTFGIKNKIRYESLAFAPVIAALCICAFYLLTFWYSFGLAKSGYVSPEGAVMKTPFEFVLGCFVFCVAAPIGEELVFRGALLGGLKSRYGVVASVLLSSLAFVLMHMSPDQVVYQFFLGCVCALAAFASGSLILPMLIHAFSNAFAVIIDYTPLGTHIERFTSFLTARPGIAVVVTIACFAVFSFLIFMCLYFIKKTNRGASVEKGSLRLENEPLASKPVTDEKGRKTIERHEAAVKSVENKDKLVFGVACGICLIIWIISLVSGYIS